jgi:hypothetical protein
MATNNPVNINTLVLGNNINGNKIIAKALEYLGVVESPALSKTGPDIDRWNSFFGQSAVDWGVAFAASMYDEANIWDMGIADPSVKIMYNRAKELNRISKTAYAGCFVIYGESDDEGNLVSGYGCDLFVRWQHPENYIMTTISGFENIGSPVTNRGVRLVCRNALYPVASDPSIKSWFIVPRAISLRESSGANGNGTD